MTSFLKRTSWLSLIIHCFTLANMAPYGFNQFTNNYFVETGTSYGDGIERAIAAGFKTIHSIEIDTKLAGLMTRKFQYHENVHIWQGDSGSILYDVIKDIDEPITFWLDTSNDIQTLENEGTPLLRELEEIKRHRIKTHTILIDDMHCTKKRIFDFLSKESIIAKIKEINPHYVIRYIPGGDFGEYPNNVMVAQVPYYQSPYLAPEILNHINRKKVKTIIEIGAFDCQDTLALHRYYNCPIVSFECAPESIKTCRNMIQHIPSIKLVESAVWNETKTIDFNYCSAHPSASSCYLFDYQIMAERDRTTIPHMAKKYATKAIKVEATRLDEWLRHLEIEQVDLICMSTQGSIMPILEGLGSYLCTTKYIVTQVMYERIYRDEALFPEVKKFMQERGFSVFNESTSDFFNTVLFVRNE